MNKTRTVQGDLAARDLRLAIVATRFNEFIVDSLVKSAVATLYSSVPGGGQDERTRGRGAWKKRELRVCMLPAQPGYENETSPWLAAMQRWTLSLPAFRGSRTRFTC